MMGQSDVLSPYLLRQNLDNLIMPKSSAPAYAFLVPDIYISLFELSHELRFKASETDSNTTLLLPFCNSFVASIETYIRFYEFITGLIQKCWEQKQFSFMWSKTWAESFGGRETGLLIERATALWFAFQPELRILGTGFGVGYPREISLDGLDSEEWLLKSSVLPNENQVQYN